MRLIKLKTVMDKTGMAKSTIYKYMEAGEFPENVKLTTRSVAWVESEINQWILDKMEAR